MPKSVQGSGYISKEHDDVSWNGARAARKSKDQGEVASSSKLLLTWQETLSLPLAKAAQIVGLSSASLYRAEKNGTLKLLRLGGRVLVDTASLIAFRASAEAWTPSKRGEAGRAKRAETAAERWR